MKKKLGSGPYSASNFHIKHVIVDEIWRQRHLGNEGEWMIKVVQ